MRFKSQREVNYTADNLKEGEVEELNEGEDEDAISNETVASDLNDSFQSSNLTSNFTLGNFLILFKIFFIYCICQTRPLTLDKFIL